MIKLALIGKNISHSLSPHLYKQYLKEKVAYDLIDCKDEKDLPSLVDLDSKYHGVNITAPYKKNFASQVSFEHKYYQENINCLYKIGAKNNKWFGVSTDLLAIYDLLVNLKIRFDYSGIFILGNGSTSSLTQFILDQYFSIPYQVFGRKKHGDLNKIIFPEFTWGKRILIINACSRNFIFQKKLNKKFLFWDYNYAFKDHDHLKQQVYFYEDGLSMLKLQAYYSIKFWKLNSYL